MGESTVRSSWSSSRDDMHPRRAESPGSRSSPSNSIPRGDGGHLVRSPGKGPSVRRDQPTLDLPETNRIISPVTDRR
jgi:hypothetical protein